MFEDRYLILTDFILCMWFVLKCVSNFVGVVFVCSCRFELFILFRMITVIGK